MLIRVVTVALWAAVASVTVAQAQTLRSIGGPAEQPPADFKGQMFVDSRGCVFLRAGYGGNTNWVARVDRDRKALCGYPPTMASLGKPIPTSEEPVQVTEAPAPEPAPIAAPAPRQLAGQPMNTVATLTTAPTIRAAAAPRQIAAAQYVPAKVLMAQPPAQRTAGTTRQVVVAPLSGTQLAAGAALAPGQIGCFVSAPVPKVVALSNGGSAVLCTRGDGTLEGARAPIYPAVATGEGNRSGAGLYAPGAQTPAPIVVPKGYRLAWKDDRLNPNRARGTAQGQLAQDQVWTRDVPQRLLAHPKITLHRVVVSTKSAPTLQPRLQGAAKASTGRFYVQVGTFGVPANAENVKARLRDAGLPIGTSKITKGGKALQIVLAGPFGDSGTALAALRAARGAGFGDAFLR